LTFVVLAAKEWRRVRDSNRDNPDKADFDYGHEFEDAVDKLISQAQVDAGVSHIRGDEEETAHASRGKGGGLERDEHKTDEIKKLLKAVIDTIPQEIGAEKCLVKLTELVTQEAAMLTKLQKEWQSSMQQMSGEGRESLIQSTPDISRHGKGYLGSPYSPGGEGEVPFRGDLSKQEGNGSLLRGNTGGIRTGASFVSGQLDRGDTLVPVQEVVAREMIANTRAVMAVVLRQSSDMSDQGDMQPGNANVGSGHETGILDSEALARLLDSLHQ
ncbi:hypothetical protein ACFL96_17115, partial [Thermoproteota archaeon]